jgi:hypothetical protein
MWWALAVTWLPVGYLASRLFLATGAGEINNNDDRGVFLFGVLLGYVTLFFVLVALLMASLTLLGRVLERLGDLYMVVALKVSPK